jgi:hypothetical protein
MTIGPAQRHMSAQIRSSNTFRINLWNAANTEICRDDISGFTAAAGRRVVLVSWDLSVPKISVYVDGVDVTGTPTVLTNDTIGYSQSNYKLGADYNNASTFNGAIELLYFDDSYIDLSVSANRDKFLAANIGSDGSGPTGSQPLLCMYGDAATWNAGTNRGSGGDFTMTGAVV